MDLSWLAEELGYDAPMALCGCRCAGDSFGCCEYNVTVFDERHGCDEARIGDAAVLVRHDSVERPAYGTFAHMSQMRVIRDDSWSIGPKISAFAKKQDALFKHAAKISLVRAKLLLPAARAMLDGDAQEAPFWTKCAAFKLADAVSYYNMAEPGGAHMMSRLRALPNSAPNGVLSVVYDCLGAERATPSLLDRMRKSAIGFLEMTGTGRIALEIIDAKARHLESQSLLTDSYYYICRAVCAELYLQRCVSGIPDSQLYALKVALDPDNNTQHALASIDSLERAVTEFMPHVGWSAQ